MPTAAIAAITRMMMTLVMVHAPCDEECRCGGPHPDHQCGPQLLFIHSQSDADNGNVRQNTFSTSCYGFPSIHSIPLTYTISIFTASVHTLPPCLLRPAATAGELPCPAACAAFFASVFKERGVGPWAFPPFVENRIERTSFIVNIKFEKSFFKFLLI